MSSDEDDDYMSLKFLDEAEQFESKRKEASYSERRKKQLAEQQKKAYIKPRAQLEKEEREKGLQTSVDESNKGMKMLLKMGFKKGSALGQGGIKEPIAVDLKSGRQGIGMDTQLKKRQHEEEEEEEEEEARKRVNIDPEDYRSIMAQKAKDAQHTRFLNAAASICKQLDEEAQVASNILWILRPTPIEDPEKDDSEEVKKDLVVKEEPVYSEDETQALLSLKLDQQLEKVTIYLRETYSYCFWCSAKYDNKEDLETNCPGPEEEDH